MYFCTLNKMKRQMTTTSTRETSNRILSSLFHICFVPRGQRTLTRQFHGCNRFWRCKLRYPALTSSFQRKPSLRSLLFRPLCSRFSQHSVVTASGTLRSHPRSTRALPVSLSNRGRRKPELAQPPYLLARVMPYFLPILTFLLLGQIQ